MSRRGSMVFGGVVATLAGVGTVLTQLHMRAQCHAENVIDSGSEARGFCDAGEFGGEPALLGPIALALAGGIAAALLRRRLPLVVGSFLAAGAVFAPVIVMENLDWRYEPPTGPPVALSPSGEPLGRRVPMVPTEPGQGLPPWREVAMSAHMPAEQIAGAVGDCLLRSAYPRRCANWRALIDTSPRGEIEVRIYGRDHWRVTTRVRPPALGHTHTFHITTRFLDPRRHSRIVYTCSPIEPVICEAPGRRVERVPPQ